ncbi:MAG: DUF4251 domain-containing protein [Ginsengibacter sp.]
MKHTKYFIATACIMLAIFSNDSFGQNKTSEKDNSQKISFKNMVDSQQFVFVAQTASPLRGGFRNLTSSYDVRVRKDTMISYLPYFGRAYTAPIDPAKSGLDFTSTNFSYTVTPNKKSGWNIVIKPKDKMEVQQYAFTVFDNGSASLNVTNTSKDPISFNGYIKKEERKRK